MKTRSVPDAMGSSVDPLLAELLVEAVTGARPRLGMNGGDSVATALTEAAMESFFRVVARASEAERVLLAQALAPALADLLVPALAQVLAPRIVATVGRIAAASGEITKEPTGNSAKKTKSGTRANGSTNPGDRG